MKNKISILVLAIAVFAACCTTIAQRSDAAVIVKPAHVQGAVFGGRASDDIRVEVRFDPAWITEADNTVFNKDLAAFCILAAADTYFREKDLKAGRPDRVLLDDANETRYAVTSFIQAMGFDDVRYVDTSRDGRYTEDIDDSATFVMAHANVGDRYDVFAFIFRGAYSFAEWCSFYSPGGSGRHHRGMDIAAKRAMEIIAEYIKAHDDDDRENCVLIAGHSRGGAIANIIGASMEDDERARPYTYTISAPPSVYDDGGRQCRTIFNIADERDIVARGLPFGDADPTNYGTNVYFDIAGRPETKDAIAALKWRDDLAPVTKEARQRYIDILKQRFPKRAALYDDRTISEAYGSIEDAQARMQRLETLTGPKTGIGLDRFVELNGPAELPSGEFAVEITYSDAGVLYGLARIMAYGNDAADAVTEVFKEDEGACAAAEWIKGELRSISSGHKIVNIYAAIEGR